LTAADRIEERRKKEREKSNSPSGNKKERGEGKGTTGRLNPVPYEEREGKEGRHLLGWENRKGMGGKKEKEGGKAVSSISLGLASSERKREKRETRVDVQIWSKERERAPSLHLLHKEEEKKGGGRRSATRS